jgi:DnaJ-class molecular chaperone
VGDYTCPYCEGDGQVYAVTDHPQTGLLSFETCPECKGEGMVDTPDRPFRDHDREYDQEVDRPDL